MGGGVCGRAGWRVPAATRGRAGRHRARKAALAALRAAAGARVWHVGCCPLLSASLPMLRGAFLIASLIGCMLASAHMQVGPARVLDRPPSSRLTIKCVDAARLSAQQPNQPGGCIARHDAWSTGTPATCARTA